MPFLIRFGFTSFIKGLFGGSTVYGIGFTETSRPNPTGIVMLTSDAGTLGGTIHAIRVEIDPEGGDVETVTREVYDKMAEVLVLEGMTVQRGVLLTEGLDEAFRLYGNSGPTTIRELEEFLKERSKIK